MNTQEKLNELSALKMAIETNREYYNGLKEDWLKQIPTEVKEALDKIDAEFNERQAEVGKQISELEAEIKLDVINLGSTVKGEFLMAVYNKGRITWDNKGLEGFMVAHPEIVAFRKEGDPSVTLRKISNKGEN